MKNFFLTLSLSLLLSIPSVVLSYECGGQSLVRLISKKGKILHEVDCSKNNFSEKDDKVLELAAAYEVTRLINTNRPSIDFIFSVMPGVDKRKDIRKLQNSGAFASVIYIESHGDKQELSTVDYMLMPFWERIAELKKEFPKKSSISIVPGFKTNIIEEDVATKLIDTENVMSEDTIPDGESADDSAASTE